MSARSLDRVAVAAMLVNCVALGFNQLAAKLALVDIPPLAQAGARSLAATLIIGVAAGARAPGTFAKDGTLRAGLGAGIFFALEFIALFLGLQWTSASHAILFLYTAPFFVALGLLVFVPEERLRPLQWVGLVVSFLGVACALLSSVAESREMLVGDLFCLAGGAFWAVSTLVVKATGLRRASPVKVLLYQLAVSAVLISLVGLALGERWPPTVAAVSALMMIYQIVAVSIAFLLWFWLLHTYKAGELSSFTFLTPLIGVVAGWLLLGDRLDAKFLFGLGLVAAGIFMVNWPQRRLQPA